VPCRAGNVLLRQKVGLVAAGRAVRSDLDDMVAWGGSSLTPADAVWVPPRPSDPDHAEEVPDVYSARLRERNGDLLPSFDPEAELTGYAQAVAELAPQELL